MALMRSGNVPKDGVVMDEIEATAYAWDLVSNWDSVSDTWALRYGPVFLGGLNALSGLLINGHYRRKLKLGSYGYLSSVIPITIMPGLLTSLFHRHLVATELLLMKNEACPICYEIKSSVIQLGFGMAYPLVLGSTAAMMFANRYSTYRVPNLLEGPKVIFQFLRKMTRPYNGTLAMFTGLQFFASAIITYFEMRNNLTIRRKMIEIENKILPISEQ